MKTRLRNELQVLVMGFVQKIRSMRVLDAACGSANFLYISLRLLLDLEKEVSNFCGEIGLQPLLRRLCKPPGSSVRAVYCNRFASPAPG